MDKAISGIEKELTQESDRTEVKEALRYILNRENFDYLKLLCDSSHILLTHQEEAREIFLYVWKSLFDEPWEYGPGLCVDDFDFEPNGSKKIKVANIIIHKKWHDKKDYIAWDTQLFFKEDGTGTLSYIHLKNENKIFLKFKYKIKENNYSNTTLMLIHFPDLNMAFELAVKVMKAMSRLYRKKNGESNVLKFSDNPFYLTQDYLNRKVHFPKETFFYQV
jgi:hypothetical protein